MTTPSVDVSSSASNAPQTTNAIFLVGFMGAGKTSVGRALARDLGWEFVDLDERIVTRAGRSVAAIFTEDGEAAFRRLEHDELRALISELHLGNKIVSLGGGTWAQPSNVDLLKSASLPVIFLDAPVEELWQRCKSQQGLRPLLKKERDFRDLYSVRSSAYPNGTLRVETHERSIEDVAQHIALLLGLAGNSRAT
jgi:shikimate kinase